MASVILDGKKVAIKKMPSDGVMLMALLGVSPQEAIMKVGGKAVPESTPLGAKSRVEIIRVVFGG